MLRNYLAAFLILLLPASAGAATSASRGMVSAADPRAAEAGRAILRDGGSASDAAMAMMLALTVVEPQSSGIGGGGFLVHHDGRSGVLSTIDGRETAPAAARPDRFVGADDKPMSFFQAVPGGLSVGVPGNIRLMEMAHRKWGRLKWAKLFTPAIHLADNGFKITPALHDRLKLLQPLWRDFPEARAIYYGKDGQPLPVGATVKNPALAIFLRQIARRGAAAFYQGRGAQAIVDAVANAPRNPAVLTEADLVSYQARERPALCGRYRSYRICGMGPPSSGATTVLGILGLLKRFDMTAFGPDSPKSWHLIGEAMRLAYADREKYLGDTDFVAVPVAGLIDRGYLASRSALLSPDKSLGKYEAGTPPGAAQRTEAVSSEVAGTTHFVAVDSTGNVASMTSTVEGPFGSQLIANGMFLNNELTDFTFAPEKDGAPVANRVQPGKRPLSSMSPTLVYDADGRLVLALGSAGGKRIIMHVAKTLIGVIDFKLPVGAAIALPNLYFGKEGLLVEKGTSLEAMRDPLTRLGHVVVAADLGSKVNAIERTEAGWRGAADPRSEGVALPE